MENILIYCKKLVKMISFVSVESKMRTLRSKSVCYWKFWFQNVRDRNGLDSLTLTWNHLLQSSRTEYAWRRPRPNSRCLAFIWKKFKLIIYFITWSGLIVFPINYYSLKSCNVSCPKCPEFTYFIQVMGSGSNQSWVRVRLHLVKTINPEMRITSRT